MDAAVLHLVPPDCQFLRAEHVCWSSGGELPQVPTVPGGGRGQEERGKETETHGEKETE